MILTEDDTFLCQMKQSDAISEEKKIVKEPSLKQISDKKSVRL